MGTRAAFLPSVAGVGPDGSLVLGELAESGNVVRQFTRRVGDDTPLRLGAVTVTAEALAANFVSHVVATVAARAGGAATRVALTHPAGWGQHRIASLRAALSAQGLGATVFLSAAQAAAQAHADRTPVSTGELVAVYDLGGTGLDAAVVRRLANGEFAPAGRPEELDPGGLDFDELVFEHVRTALGEQWAALDATDPAVLTGVARLRRECALAKEALSADTDVQVPVVLPGIDTRVRLARAEFEELIRPSVEETAATLVRAIGSAGVEPEEVTTVLLTGGSARIPLVTQVVSEILGRPVTVAADPKGDTAVGAALAVGGLEADVPAARPQSEPTRIALRAAPHEGENLPSPPRPPVPVGPPATEKPGPFGLRRSVAASAATFLALVVAGGIALGSHYFGPKDADADIDPAGTIESTERSDPTTPPSPTTTAPNSPQEPTETPRRRRTQEPQQTEQTEQTTSEPTETTTTTPPEPTPSEPPTTTAPSAPDGPEDTPAERSADPNQPGGDR
ncbi:Hsp70 family protein [Actinophytocola sp.]|uniref:Hsp70 family protein n=1 Tax=Actinophytocola sp. TaxID=1872138 RepID=UPI0025C66D50|nr:Hsp70 family protein [Actinophytocola sp.]